MQKSTIDDCKTIDLNKVHNPAGDITVVENNLSFKVKRIYYLYDIPFASERGGHAHKDLYQLIVAASGSFIVTIDDGQNKKNIFLNQPDKGLIIVPGIWRTLSGFSSGSICLVLASEKYDENDYIRIYERFKTYKKNYG